VPRYLSRHELRDIPPPLVGGGRKLSPSTASVPTRDRVLEGVDLLRHHWRQRRDAVDFGWVFDDIAGYERTLATYGGPPLTEARVLEIGHGVRPYRLLALLALGVDATGIDPEVAQVDGSLAELRAAWRHNGAERVVKTMARRLVSDGPRDAAFARALAARHLAVRPDHSRLLVGDAGELELEPGSLDLVLSEDVFEHVDREALERLVPRMARWLWPDGLAVVRPNVWTGITGGHLVEWNRQSFRRRTPRRTEPWEHLRAGRRHANTRLNHLFRSEYRTLFARSFELLEETVTLPDLGREHLAGRVADELAGIGEDELFSNQVRFVLRPRRGAA
jgi:hypothetical protein